MQTTAGMTTRADPFAARLLDWHARHGRHDLPWQHPRTPWRVWVSEIMLQQTQVVTAIPYFERFMARFPEVQDLAIASADDVMAYWSGLGYYARARNLHRAAQQVVEKHGGRVPDTHAELHALPGIGPSTASAICAQAFDQAYAVLDANVKRVMARHAGIDGWPGSTLVTQALQREADARLPKSQLVDYTQAIMDLGATLCRARRPDCARCPVAADCHAHRHGLTHQLPAAKPRRERPQRHGYLLLANDRKGRIWMQRRPPTGIWGGLWAPPIVEQLTDAATHGLMTEGHSAGDALTHQFTHFSWHLQPVQAHRDANATELQDATGDWLTIEAALQRGLPAPVRRLLEHR